ncbi:MAG: hypothetical protein UIM27_02085 [Acutalibacteraceae bacterium]|nr:hypothetical protein [Acutalibacteraceae bacterium]
MPELVKLFLEMNEKEQVLFFKRVIQNSEYDESSYAEFLKSCIVEAEREIREE